MHKRRAQSQLLCQYVDLSILIAEGPSMWGFEGVVFLLPGPSKHIEPITEFMIQLQIELVVVASVWNAFLVVITGCAGHVRGRQLTKSFARKGSHRNRGPCRMGLAR